MRDDKTFTYTYSAVENKEIEQIRKRYMPQEKSKYEELRRLDSRVQMAGIAESLAAGIIGSLLFGIAMCIGTEVLKGGIVLAVINGIIGVGIMLTAYPIYRKMVEKAKTQYTPRILQLIEEIGVK